MSHTINSLTDPRAHDLSQVIAQLDAVMHGVPLELAGGFREDVMGRLRAVVCGLLANLATHPHDLDAEIDISMLSANAAMNGGQVAPDWFSDWLSGTMAADLRAVIRALLPAPAVVA